MRFSAVGILIATIVCLQTELTGQDSWLPDVYAGHRAGWLWQDILANQNETIIPGTLQEGSSSQLRSGEGSQEKLPARDSTSNRVRDSQEKASGDQTTQPGSKDGRLEKSMSSAEKKDAEKKEEDSKGETEKKKDEAKQTEEPPAFQTCCRGQLIDWSEFPATIQPFPRPGIFAIPPSGPAYFTVLDQWCGNCLETPRKSGYAPFAINAWPFHDADWRFLEKVDCGERNFVERLKRIHPNDCWLIGTGGQYWLKYHHEQNSRLTEAVNDYTLYNVRLYSDIWYRDRLRFYGEYIWADSIGEELPPGPFDVDLGDLQALFADVKLFDWRDKPVFIRGGRMELLYGSQRLISPLPWANKRNSFQGLKLFRQGVKWDYDLFWTQFVPPNPDGFDQADSNQNIVGNWITYRPQKGTAVDAYYLLFDNDNTVSQQGINRAPIETHTMGSRYSGDKEGLLWDFEGAIQFGDQTGGDLFAGMATAGLGRNWKSACWNPTAWLYYDYASGDANPNAGGAHTFNQLFPFGHYYFGWTDLVGRQNIHDLNAHVYVYPAAWLTCWLQYHHFWLDQPRDALYNAGGVAIRRDPTGNSGVNVGDELGFVFNFHLTNYSDVLMSYNHLFGGEFLENTSDINAAADAEAFYFIFQQRW
jgi:hypothetical protein